MNISLIKFAEPFFLPLGGACVLLVLALLTSFLRPWASRFCLVLALATLWGLGVPVGARLLVAPLETRFPVPPAAVRADAAVVLAGTVDLARSTPERIELYDRPERIIEGAQLVLSGRARWLVISGGSGDPLRPEAREAEYLATLARRLGVPSGQILLQGDSRTTAEDAERTAAILRRRGIQSFFLVTSAFHLPRAVACFRKQGLEPIPYPVDFRVTPVTATLNPYVPTAGGLRLSILAVHEYLGLAGYWALRRL
ncbi:MAG TPA: YdcF family protein [Deferrisomatales bacterium]|nr:YdcF family protein [Deferrisomatales bacterium]